MFLILAARYHEILRLDLPEGSSSARNAMISLEALETIPLSDPRPDSLPSPSDAPRRRLPLHEHLGIETQSVGDGRSHITLLAEPHHLRSAGIVHGGVIAALLDASQGMAALSVAPAGHDVVTVQLNVNFIRVVALGESVEARGEVLHAGRRTAVTRGEVMTASGALVAAGSATLLYLPHDRRATPPPASPSD